MADTRTTADKKLKVFISYSRKDVVFADRLAAALEAWGAEPLIDKDDIYALEDWWKRIQVLIRGADAVIFTLSPNAVASDICKNEVAFAVSLNKRLAPIVYRRVELEVVPKDIAQINFIFFDDEAKFDESFNRLTDALSTNIEWVRRHTEFGVDSRNWDAAKRPGGLLLRSPLLEEAEQWIASRPDGAPEPTAETREFILQSRLATTRRRNIVTGSLAAGLIVALGLAGLAYWQRSIAVDRRDEALRAESRFLAEHSRQTVEAGDATGAAHIALAALPDADENRNRPLVRVAQSALYHALTGPRELSFASMKSFDGIEDILLSPDQKQLIALTRSQGFIRPQVWSLPNVELNASLPAHPESVVVGFVADGTKVITYQRRKPEQDDQDAKKAKSGEPKTTPNPPITSDMSEGLAQIFDAKTGARTSTLGTFDMLAVTKGGDKFMTLVKGGKLTLWDGRTVTPSRVFDLPTTDVFPHFFGGDRLARFRTAGDDILNLDLTTGAILKDSEVPNLDDADAGERTRKLSPDGARLVTGRDYKGHLRMSLHEAAPQKKLIAELESGGAGQFHAAFSSDSRLLATTGGGNQAKIWDARTGKLIHALQGHSGPVLSVSFFDQARRLLTTSADGSIRMWSVATGEPLQALSGHTATGAYVSDDGKRLLSVGSGSLRLWGLADAATTFSFNPVLPVQTKTIRLSQDGSRLLLGTTDEQSLYVVTASSTVPARLIKLAPLDVPDWCTPIAGAGARAKGRAAAEQSDDDTKPRRTFWFSNDGTRLLAANAPTDGDSNSSALKLRPRCAWDLDTGRLVGNPPFALSGDTPDDDLDDARPNDKRLALAPLTLLVSEAGSLQVYDLRNRRIISTLKHGAAPPRSWQFHEDSALLLVGQDEVARIFDPKTGEPLSTVSASGREVGKASLGSQGKRLFIEWRDPVSEERRGPNLDLYDAATGKLIKSYAIGYGRTHISARRNFAVIPTAVDKYGGEQGPMQVLDATTGEKSTTSHPGVRTCAFATSRKMVGSCS